jgi:phage baseplate assembly protein W
MSTEILSDKSLENSRAIVVARSRDFSDLDLRFKPHPNLGDLVPLRDIAAIKNSVRNLILTGYGERPFQPTIGCAITDQLFENFTPVTVAAMQESISRTLRFHEPRVSLAGISITDKSDENAVFVSVTVKILNVPDLVDIDIYLERIR